MFIGHYGVGLALKKGDADIPLWKLFTAVSIIDIIHYILGIAGIEKVEIVPGFTRWVPLTGISPYTHSLAGMALISAAVTAAVLVSGRMRLGNWRSGARTALVLGLAVFSHFFCDLAVHGKDILLAGPESARMGLGMWNYPVASNLLEIGMYIGGLAIYFRTLGSTAHQVTRNMVIFSMMLIIFHVSLGLVPPVKSIPVVYSMMLAVSLLILVAAGRLEKELHAG